MESINLMGSDDVYKAGYTIQNAANDMKQAVANFDFILERQRRFMDEWLQKFERILTENKL